MALIVQRICGFSWRTFSVSALAKCSCQKSTPLRTLWRSLVDSPKNHKKHKKCVDFEFELLLIGVFRCLNTVMLLLVTKASATQVVKVYHFPTAMDDNFNPRRIIAHRQVIPSCLMLRDFNKQNIFFLFEKRYWKRFIRQKSSSGEYLSKRKQTWAESF